MKTTEFNRKWSSRIKDNIPLQVNNPIVTKYLDDEFDKEVKKDKEFIIFEVKAKKGCSRVYTTNSRKNWAWAERIDSILRFNQ